jgi:hypothetical protein
MWLVVVLSLAGLAVCTASAAPVAGPALSQPGSEQAQSSKPEVFCEAKSAGQLCLHGSITTLRLDDARRDRWMTAGRRYNEAVDQATTRFLAEAKAFLTPEEYAVVERWFDKGLNAVLNQHLLDGGSTPETRRPH